jgi:hypothetical protein
MEPISLYSASFQTEKHPSPLTAAQDEIGADNYQNYPNLITKLSNLCEARRGFREYY